MKTKCYKCTSGAGAYVYLLDNKSLELLGYICNLKEKYFIKK